jgi:hypothetical protein
MARLPNKGLALRQDLGERSTATLRRVGYQIVPKNALEILRSDPIRIVCRSSERNRKIAESNVEEVLECDVNLSEGGHGR